MSKKILFFLNTGLFFGVAWFLFLNHQKMLQGVAKLFENSGLAILAVILIILGFFLSVIRTDFLVSSISSSGRVISYKDLLSISTLSSLIAMNLPAGILVAELYRVGRVTSFFKVEKKVLLRGLLFEKALAMIILSCISAILMLVSLYGYGMALGFVVLCVICVVGLFRFLPDRQIFMLATHRPVSYFGIHIACQITYLAAYAIVIFSFATSADFFIILSVVGFSTLASVLPLSALNFGGRELALLTFDRSSLFTTQFSPESWFIFPVLQNLVMLGFAIIFLVGIRNLRRGNA